MARVIVLLFAFAGNGCRTANISPDLADIPSLARQAAELLPATASLGYDTCMHEKLNRKLEGLKEFDPSARLDQTYYPECEELRGLSVRITSSFNALVVYLQELARLATNRSAILDLDAGSLLPLPATAIGQDSRQDEAIGQLIKFIIALSGEGTRHAKLPDVIRTAQPMVVDVTNAFEELTRFSSQFRDADAASILSYYREMSLQDKALPPGLLWKAYSAEMQSLSLRQEQLKTFNRIVAGIRRAHTLTYEHLNDLSSPAYLRQLHDEGEMMHREIGLLLAQKVPEPDDSRPPPKNGLD
jgi:hypothetical protein